MFAYGKKIPPTPGRKKKSTAAGEGKKRAPRKDRYEDFLEYTAANPDVPIVEIDSVEAAGWQGAAYSVLPQLHPHAGLSAGQEHGTVCYGGFLNGCTETLGHEQYCRLFPIILTDRGSEFTDPVSIECTELERYEAEVFYCNPQRSDQKGSCEVTHEFIRRILPKGTSLTICSRAISCS